LARALLEEIGQIGLKPALVTVFLSSQAKNSFKYAKMRREIFFLKMTKNFPKTDKKTQKKSIL